MNAASPPSLSSQIKTWLDRLLVANVFLVILGASPLLCPRQAHGRRPEGGPLGEGRGFEGFCGAPHPSGNAEMRWAACVFCLRHGFFLFSGRPCHQERSGAVVSVLGS